MFCPAALSLIHCVCALKCCGYVLGVVLRIRHDDQRPGTRFDIDNRRAGAAGGRGLLADLVHSGFDGVEWVDGGDGVVVRRDSAARAVGATQGDFRARRDSQHECQDDTDSLQLHGSLSSCPIATSLSSDAKCLPMATAGTPGR